MRNLLVKNGTVFTYIHEGYHALKLRKADVLIEDDVIVKIDDDIAGASCETLDASGCLVLPGMINIGGCAVASKLLQGLLQDNNWSRHGGTPVHTRVLPVLGIAQQMLAPGAVEAVAALALWEGLAGGTTTALDICPPRFVRPVKKAAEKLGLRLYAAATRSDALKSGDAAQGKWDFPAIYSLEAESDALVRRIAAENGPRFAYAAYSSYEDSPVKRLSDLGFLQNDTTLCQCVLADRYDVELMSAAGCSVSLSAVACAQEGKKFPALDFLRSGVNTALGTGFYGNCMISEMRTAAFLAKLGEGNGGQYQATDAFYAATVAGARALGRHDVLGRVDIGMRGDVSVVFMDRFMPLSYPFIQYLYGASQQDVRHVVCGGRVCKRDYLPFGDTAAALEASRKQAKQAISAVWSDAIKYVL